MKTDCNIKTDILIVEDHSLTRFGLHTAFESVEHINQIYEAEDAETAIDIIKEQNIDIILMDLGLPGMDGIEAIKIIKELNPKIKIVVLTSHNNEAEVLEAIKAGAHAYCLKDIKPDKLIQVVDFVSDGAAWLDPSVSHVVWKSIKSTEPANKEKEHVDLENQIQLTEREKQVLKLIVEGKNNADIAKSLYVSIHTTKAHVCNILQKLSVDDRTQAAIKAIKDGLV